ncbi:hypothetical protein K440DRAFT_504072, partial [Wilcoxina mikolae CBS 423.85]
YVLVSTLRQQLMPDQRMGGIITEGGTAVNVIPAVTRGEWIVRARNKGVLEVLVGKVVGCLNAGAAGSGCKVEIMKGLPYLDLRPNRAMGNYFTESMNRDFGKKFLETPPVNTPASGAFTDQGNVSYEFPCIHP